MKKYLIIALTAFGLTNIVTTSNAQSHCKEIIGYYPNWQQYKRNALFHQKNLDFSKYTLINYAFMNVDENGEVQIIDPWGDMLILGGKIDWTKTTDPDNPVYYPYTNMVDLAHRVGTKVVVSLGGWTLSEGFTYVAADPVKRANFASSCVKTCKKWNFDGIDIDWEFPGDTSHCGRPSIDTQNFTLMIKQLRDSLDAYSQRSGKKHLLTAVFHGVPSLAKWIDFPAVEPMLDYVSFFGYDFGGAWSDVTTHQAPLYAPEVGDQNFNIDAVFKLATEQYKMPKEKIILGTGFYGRSIKGCVGGAGLFVKHSGQPDAETFNIDEGTPSYYNILLKINEFDVKWDDKSKVPYLLGKKIPTFVGYDDPKSIEEKAKYIINKGAAGCLIWEISNDLIETFPGSGIIAGTPLIDKINEVFWGYCERATIEAENPELEGFDLK